MTRVLKKKKIERQDRIFNAAFKLFNEKGFTKTSMKDIALEAHLGVGTLYNYYPSKGDLLLELNKSKMEELFQEGEKYLDSIKNSNKKCRQVLKDLIREVFTYMLQLNKEYLQDIFSAFFQSKKMLEEGILMDLSAIDFFQKLLLIFQKKGEISSDLDLKEVTYILYGILIMNIMSYVFLTNEDSDAIFSSFDSQIDILFKGLK